MFMSPFNFSIFLQFQGVRIGIMVAPFLSAQNLFWQDFYREAHTYLEQVSVNQDLKSSALQFC